MKRALRSISAACVVACHVVLCVVLFAALFGATFSCCPPQDPAKVQAQLISRLVDETVNLVDEDGDMYCGGVWVTKDQILTAAHCVDDLGMSEQDKFIHAMAEEAGVELPAYDPVGQKAFWKVQSDAAGVSLREGILVKFNRKVDLALVHVVQLPGVELPLHAVASLRVTALSLGDPVHIVGHPINKLWSYSHGYVSNVSVKFRSMPGVVWLQLDANINSGNSGGGTFDSMGKLVGIVTASNHGGLSWAASQYTIRKFLQ